MSPGWMVVVRDFDLTSMSTVTIHVEDFEISGEGGRQELTQLRLHAISSLPQGRDQHIKLSAGRRISPEDELVTQLRAAVQQFVGK